jgi:hypothetical protein
MPWRAYLHEVRNDPAGDHAHWDLVFVFCLEKKESLQFDPNESCGLEWLSSTELEKIRLELGARNQYQWNGAPLSARTLDILHNCEADWSDQDQEIPMPGHLI